MVSSRASRPGPAAARLLVALALAVPALGACGVGGAEGDGDRVGASVSQATSGFPTMEAPDFAQRMSEPGTVLIDVRTPEEFRAGHIEGARNLDLEGGELALEARAGSLDPGTTYALYCRSDRRSAQAMRLLADHGVRDVYDLDGGMDAWQAYGGAVTPQR